MKHIGHFSISIVFLFISFAGFSQESKDQQAIQLYDQILKTRNPNTVLELLKDFRIEEVSIDSLKSYLNYYKGTAFGQLGKLDSAIFYVDLSKKQLPKGENPHIEIQILRAYGNIYWAKSFFNLSLEHYQESLNIADQIGHAEFQISLLGNIAGIYAKLDNLNLALEYAEKAEFVSKRSGILRPRSHLKIGLYAVLLGHFEKGITSLQETIKRIEVDHRDSIALGVCYDNIAKAYLGLNNAELARKNLKTASQIFSNVGYEEPVHFGNWANLALMEGKLNDAKTYVSESIAIASRNGDLTDLLLAKQIEKNLAMKMGQFQKAILIQDEILTLSDSIKSTETLNRVYELETIYNTTKKEAEIERLSLENELHTANLAKSRNAQFAIAIGGSMTILVLAVYFFQRNKKLKAEGEAQELRIEALQKRLTDLNINHQETQLDLKGLNAILQTPLTEREFEALRLSLLGKTNSEIADGLFISISTVKFHLRNTYSKLGVNNRKEALVYVSKSS